MCNTGSLMFGPIGFTWLGTPILLVLCVGVGVLAIWLVTHWLRKMSRPSSPYTRQHVPGRYEQGYPPAPTSSFTYQEGGRLYSYHPSARERPPAPYPQEIGPW
jgi:hypothetical protein